jgi:S-adenosylmethionine:tRNA ribosyltransferase-isomerase
MQTSDFDYHLPKEQIAQAPAIPRESAKLMILKRDTGNMEHVHVSDFPSYIRPGDVLVVNNTKVFKARLIGSINTPDGQKPVEVFLVRAIGANHWLTLCKPGKKLSVGSVITLADSYKTTVVKKNEDGTVIVTFPMSDSDVIAMANAIGHVPVPPYITNEPDEKEYQTAYAKITGSVAAPTAGFHLTKRILEAIRQKGATIIEITLHVGLGTFLPIKTDTIETHPMHSEWVEISDNACDAIMQAKSHHQRVIAVGTTTVRTLEGVAMLHNGILKPYRGDVNLFISPGFQFSVIDAMLTNFHLPKSTLLVLISSFAGREHILHAYTEAVAHQYRFYSFGDAMFIC